MSSSGIKRGLAATAVSALAVAGLPFLASSASATPISDSAGANQIWFAAPNNGGMSTKSDGQNTTVSLSVVGGINVTSVSFQYTTDAGTTWTQIPGATVARNADGVFRYDWATPVAGTNELRATPNTGTGNAMTTGSVTLNNSLETVELSTEGALGVFQAPYVDSGDDGDFIAVHGTTSTDAQTITVQDYSHTSSSAGADIDAFAAGATSGPFEAVLNIIGYPYDPGTDPNQILLRASNNDTDDAEASTLYVQTIASITATPATQQRADPANSEIVLKVLDTTGKLVAHAEIGQFNDQGTVTTADDVSSILGYTDANGEFLDDTQTTAGTFTYYVNTTDTDAYNAGTDKSTTATVTSYTPAFSTVSIVNERNRTVFDLDELSDSDDFTVVFKDQSGNGYQDPNVDAEYRYVIDPTDPTKPTFTTGWISATDLGSGKYTVGALTTASYNGGQPPVGNYTLEARRPNFLGSGLTNATPVTFHADESDIVFAEGTDATAPVNGEFTATGQLTLNDGTAGLAGRLIEIQFSSSGDSALAPQASQPAGVTLIGGGFAEVVTGAGGSFSVVLTDPDVAPNVTPTPEDGTLSAYGVQESATDGTWLSNSLGQNSTNGGNPDSGYSGADDLAELDVHFKAQAAVDSIEIDVNDLMTDLGAHGYSVAGPGRPVELGVTVYGKDGDTDPSNNPQLSDYPVTVTVDKGFLSPDAQDQDDLTLAAGHNTTGDLFGFYKSLGQSQALSTGDNGDAGIVAAMERDAGFDTDGLSTMTVTVTAGGVTKTQTITFDATAMLNQGSSTLERAAGAPTGAVPVGQDLDFRLLVHDQFGNLVGDQEARVSDDSTVADFTTDEEFDTTLSDYTNSGPGVTAFSGAAATQTLSAVMSPSGVLVDSNGDPGYNNKNVTITSEPIDWVAQPHVDPASSVLLGTNNGAKADKLVVNAPAKAKGAVVKLFKIVAGKRKLVSTDVLDSQGDRRFTVADKNGAKKTTYVAVVQRTATTKADTTNKKSVN
ncbi:MAG: hypothetical protein JWO11_846 [Nocardioides sp.]|nr:hypothetical protein [Nocardioides sp.]